jgi:UDP-glucose 4-epimerase
MPRREWVHVCDVAGHRAAHLDKISSTTSAHASDFGSRSGYRRLEISTAKARMASARLD